MGFWVGPRTGLDIRGEKIPLLLTCIELSFFITVVYSLYWLSYLALLGYSKMPYFWSPRFEVGHETISLFLERVIMLSNLKGKPQPNLRGCSAKEVEGKENIVLFNYIQPMNVVLWLKYNFYCSGTAWLIFLKSRWKSSSKDLTLISFIPLNTKCRLLYLKIQFIPCSKHFSSRL